jgi:hypothetical protein
MCFTLDVDQHTVLCCIWKSNEAKKYTDDVFDKLAKLLRVRAHNLWKVQG